MSSVHRFTSEDSDKLFHLPALEVKHFPFNVVLFRLIVSTYRDVSSREKFPIVVASPNILEADHMRATNPDNPDNTDAGHTSLVHNTVTDSSPGYIEGSYTSGHNSGDDGGASEQTRQEHSAARYHPEQPQQPTSSAELP